MFHKLKKCLLVAVTGIVLATAVTAGAMAANVTAKSCVPVRAGASSNNKIVTVLKAGQTVEKNGTSGNWVKISANGKSGYVYKTYITDGGNTRTHSSKKPNDTPIEQDKKYMGKFKLSFYAGHSMTASGRPPRVNHTIAADTSLLPMYTKVYIDGWGTYVVEDRGGAIKNKRIDIFVESQAVANKLGIKYADVYIVND